MQKKLIALALASAFAAPAAFAATANVDVGGYLNFSVDYLDADSNNNQDGVLNVSSNSSNIFFKGSEDLGGGLKAIWQIQTFFSAGGTGNADTGLGEAVKDGVGSGNTYVGLSGGFGTVLLGKHESPTKLVGRRADLFGDQLGDNRNLLSKPNGQTNGWDLRPNNVIAYVSPNFSGLTATVAYVADAGSNTTATDNSTTAWSGSLEYVNGPLELRLGYENHDVAAPNSDERVWRLSGGYSFGDLKLVALYQDSNNDANTADVKTWGLGAAYKLGAITLKGQYYRAGDEKGTSNTSAYMYALGADYALSKRTTVYAGYAKTNNDSNAKYDMAAGGHGDKLTSLVTGADPSGFQIGVKHSF